MNCAFKITNAPSSHFQIPNTVSSRHIVWLVCANDYILINSVSSLPLLGTAWQSHVRTWAESMELCREFLSQWRDDSCCLLNGNAFRLGKAWECHCPLMESQNQICEFVLAPIGTMALSQLTFLKRRVLFKTLFSKHSGFCAFANTSNGFSGACICKCVLFQCLLISCIHHCNGL